MAISLEQLSSLSATLIEQPTGIKIIVTLGILLVGTLIGRLAAKVARRFYSTESEEMVDKIKDREREPVKWIEYGGLVVTITIALVYLNASATNQLFSQIIQFLPSLLTAVLTFLLGIVIVKLLMDFLTGFIETVGVKQYAQSIGFSTKLVDAFFQGLKIFLYLLILEISVIQLGFYSSQVVGNTLTAASYGVVGLLGLLGFFGFKDLVQNYAAGIYLRGSDVLKPGKKVKIDEESGEIRNITAFGTTITTDTGYFMMMPNKKLMDKNIMFKRVKADVETLNDIKQYFVAQEPSYCGPASAEMILAMFGFDISQEQLAERSGTSQPGGVLPDDLTTAIEDLTSGEVRAAYIEHDKITELDEEFKTWFNDGGLIIANFAKPMLFPNTDTGHYSVSVGVEGSELLIVDPSAHTVSGGVYYVDSTEMLDAMAEWEGRQRGYIVLAPKGTTAYWRIKEDLIYADTSVYDQLSKSLELQLSRILRRGRILTNAMPESVEEFLGRWRREERVQRLWKPDNDDKGGDTKLDEFTDTDE